MNIASLLGGNILDGVKGIIGQFVTDPTKKAELEAQAATLAAKQAEIIELTVQKEIDAKASIIKAELEQGDDYTKRARPTIVYVGLGAMLVNYVLCPWLAFFTKGGVTLPTIAIPTDFWTVWGGVCGAYVIGRTFEKSGMTLPFCKPTK